MIKLGTADGQWVLQAQADGTIRIERRWGSTTAHLYTCRTQPEVEGRLRELGYELADLVEL